MRLPLAKMTSASAVVDEYSMRLDRVRKDQQKIEEENTKTIETTTAYMRQQAEKTVAEQEAAEATLPDNIPDCCGN